MKDLSITFTLLSLLFACEQNSYQEPEPLSKEIISLSDDENLQNYMGQLNSARLSSAGQDYLNSANWETILRDIKSEELIVYSIPLPSSFQQGDILIETLIISNVEDNYDVFMLRSYLSEEKIQDIELANLDGDITFSSLDLSANGGRVEGVECVEITIDFPLFEVITPYSTNVTWYSQSYTVCTSDGGGDLSGLEPIESGGGKSIGILAPDLCDDGAIRDKEGECISEEDAWEEKIDDTNLKPCMQTILTDLKNLTKGVGNVVTLFAGSTPNVNWEVKDGTLASNVNAETSTVFNSTTGTVTTTFDSFKFGSATDLSIARTMLHESVHAYVVSIHFNFINTSDWRNALLGKNWVNAFTNSGHDFMATDYLRNIADSLEEYGNIQGYSHSRSFYEDLAWGGLESSALFTGLPVSDQTRIRNVILVELTGKDFSGNAQPQQGINAGC